MVYGFTFACLFILMYCWIFPGSGTCLVGNCLVCDWFCGFAWFVCLFVWLVFVCCYFILTSFADCVVAGGVFYYLIVLVCSLFALL